MDFRATEGRRRLAKMMHLKSTKDRDEDLILFKELNKRENERRGSLLQPVSEEFDKHGNYPLYRIPSARKVSGNELLGENDKNDYDWLKTPPATPLFPSLEMENPAPQLVIQKEIPIIIPQPPSRFAAADLSEPPNLKTSSDGSKSSNLKPKFTLRPVNTVQNPQRPSTATSTVKIGSNKSTSAFLDQELLVTRDSNAKTKTLNMGGGKKPTSMFMKREHVVFDSECNHAPPTNSVGLGNKQAASEFEEKESAAACDSDSKSKPTNLVGARKATTAFEGQEKLNRESNNHSRTTNLHSIRVKLTPQNGTKEMEVLASNFAKKMQVNNNDSAARRKQKSRDVSPHVRSTLPVDFSNEKPENVRTERRSVSSMRGRLGILTSTAATGYTKPEALARHQRNSCSPSVARGRKQAGETSEESSSVQKIRSSLSTAMGGIGKGTHVMGSKMVDKVMNARKGNNQNEMRDKQSRNPKKISSSVKS